MKQLLNYRAALDAALSRLNLDLNDEKKDKLLLHLMLVEEKNQELNLTRILDMQEAIILHIEDSLSIYKEFCHSNGEFCDIGTGAGFPGIPLAIVSERSGFLIDGKQKKAKAVESFLKELNLTKQIQVKGLRSEELCKHKYEQFDTIVTRALAKSYMIEELASPLLKYSGHLIIMKGIEDKEETFKAIKISNSLGFEYMGSRKFTIGDGKYSRIVFVFEKNKPPKLKLPRKPGFAVSKPLI